MRKLDVSASIQEKRGTKSLSEVSCSSRKEPEVGGGV